MYFSIPSEHIDTSKNIQMDKLKQKKEKKLKWQHWLCRKLLSGVRSFQKFRTVYSFMNDV